MKPYRLQHLPSATIRMSGFTVIELLVGVGVVGLLASLIIPAVQSSREAARRMSCRSNLHQILLAFHQHEDIYGEFPGLVVDGEHWNVRILPYLDQQKPVRDGHGAEISGPGAVPLYVCPSDSLATGKLVAGHSSYYPSDGKGGPFHDGLYMTRSQRAVRSSDVRDGLSATAAVSERLAFPDGPEFAGAWLDDPRYERRIVRYTSAFLADLDTFADECESHSIAPQVTLVAVPNYNHIQTPNRRSCTNGPAGFPHPDSYPAATASSMHPGGVNLALADGAVRFVSESIDRKVWRAIGTRDGGEAGGGEAITD